MFDGGVLWCNCADADAGADVTWCGVLCCGVAEQKPDHFEIKADVPGFTKDQMSVEVHDGVVTISADRSEEKTSDDADKNGVKWHRVERSSGSLRRQVKLPATANLDAITAASADGVLTVTVAKKAADAGTASRSIKIA